MLGTQQEGEEVSRDRKASRLCPLPPPPTAGLPRTWAAPLEVGEGKSPVSPRPGLRAQAHLTGTLGTRLARVPVGLLSECQRGHHPVFSSNLPRRPEHKGPVALRAFMGDFLRSQGPDTSSW